MRVGRLGGEVVDQRDQPRARRARPVVLLRLVGLDGDRQRLVHADLLGAQERVVLGGVDLVEGLV